MLAHLHARRCPASQVMAAEGSAPAGSHVGRLSCKVIYLTAVKHTKGGNTLSAALKVYAHGLCV